MFLELAGLNRLALGINTWGDHVRTLVHIGEEEGRGYSWAVVEAGASVPMAASANLEVEGAVDPVLLRTEDRSQVLSHCLRERKQII